MQIVAVKYRHATQADLPEVAEVFGIAIDDLDRRHGFFEEPTPAVPARPLYGFWLEKEPHAFWVAESGGRLVGFAFSFLRGSFWFLADLFILPEQQGKGIGGALIQKTLGSWKGRRISNRALITPAFNRSSVSLYMRHGMLPRQPVYACSVQSDAFASKPGLRPEERLDVQEAGGVEAASPMIDHVHRRAMGFPAGWHTEFFFKVQRSRCLIFRKKGRLAGYSFIRPDGRIGPLVVLSELSFVPALELTFREALQGRRDKLGMLIPGTNAGAVEASIQHGFRIEYPLLFLSSRPMGDFGNYLFHSPGLM